ncbi:AAA family ATPase [Micromonospora sp. DT81.3]|uniref:AAA family ATPase n=1 Tax=Micromonospora sp. DT81.3 TaxID=3416523 RepID=UPI003CF7BB49
MQLTDLELRNWGPFFEDHLIPLSVDEAAPVILFRGENMRGKTSLLRAIVWCLYGEIKEQDGRTPLDVARMVNIDALRSGQADFSVRLGFSHSGSVYSLYRSGVATEDAEGRPMVSNVRVDLIPAGGQPFPAAQIQDIINGVLSREISDFYLFDGEMLNRFEERLRAERAASQSFVRMQVERALGLPFLEDLSQDLDSLESGLTASMEQVLRRSNQHKKLSESYREKADALDSMSRDLAKLRATEQDLADDISNIDAQLANVDEIKELYYERKSLERDLDAADDAIKDLQEAIADRTDALWWLPMAEQLITDLEAVESEIVEAEGLERERLALEFRANQIEEQLASGFCAACGQPVAIHNEAELRTELSRLRGGSASASVLTLDQLRPRRDRLRKFAGAPNQLQWLHDQERDLRRERLRRDKREQRIRQISEQFEGETLDIEVLERTLSDLKFKQSRVARAIADLDETRMKLKQEVQRLGTRLADQPEVDATERVLQHTLTEALEVVGQSFEAFTAAMRERVEDATSELFLQLTTEKQYSGVTITDDYQLTLTDQESRPMSVISAGANQILTMAFIGALAQCSVDEAPMVMDTPFGRLDLGHRSAILEWVSSFETQVIMFVQSGEYDVERDSHHLAGRIGREYTIDRLSPNRSEVSVA